MARTREYHHYCPVARSLEVIGEKWSLLVVRDLLRGPQRFTDLLRCLGGITPKWLTQRLRDLEAAGIVERDQLEGRREVWYRLTPKGRELAPVVESLAIWGIDHALRPPLPDEPIRPEQSLYAIAAYRNRRGVSLAAPAAWELRFGSGQTHHLRFNGERWSVRGEVAEPVVLTIETTPEHWVRFVTATLPERRELAADMRIEGEPERIEEFVRTFETRGDLSPDPSPARGGVPSADASSSSEPVASPNVR